MGAISQVTEATAANAYSAAENTKKTQAKEEQDIKKVAVSGQTIGEPKLSEKAAKYYDKLRKQYGNMDFILVSNDMKEIAKSQAGRYANANRMVVLIDEEKIERMAEDENYRKQYEGIISSAAARMPQLASSLQSKNVKSFGMQVNDNGTTSFFAVMDKSFASQRKRIEQMRDKKAADKKAAAKKDAKKAAEEKRAEQIEEKRKADRLEDEDTITVTASSIDELLRKIDDVIYSGMSDNVWTEQEKMVGQSFDFRG